MTDRKALLREGMTYLGIPWTENQIQQLSAYCAEIDLWNKRYNLVRSSGEDFIRRHVFDALSAYPALKRLQPAVQQSDFRIADVGSGNGIPGIPLAVMCSECRVVLVERSGSRAGFLMNALAVSGLSKRVNVFEGDVKNLKDSFPLITLRAVSSLQEIVMLVSPLLEKDGAVAAYKGQEAKVREELSQLNASGDEWNYNIEPLENPYQPDYQRRLVYLRRRKPEDPAE